MDPIDDEVEGGIDARDHRWAGPEVSAGIFMRPPNGVAESRLPIVENKAYSLLIEVLRRDQFVP
jgi:hypothetical protein